MDKNNNKDRHTCIDQSILRTLSHTAGPPLCALRAALPKTTVSGLTEGVARLLGRGEIVKTTYGGKTRYYLGRSRGRGRRLAQPPEQAEQDSPAPNLALPRSYINATVREPLPPGDAFLNPNYVSL